MGEVARGLSLFGGASSEVRRCGYSVEIRRDLSIICVFSPEREREIVLGRTRHTQFVSYTSRRRVVLRVDPHARVRSSMVGAPMRLPPRTRVTTLHTSLNRRIQSTEPSGATSSPSAQGRARRILEDAIRARGVVCVIFVVRSPAPRLPRGSLVAPGRERRGRRM